MSKFAGRIALTLSSLELEFLEEHSMYKINLWEMKEIFGENNLKFKIKVHLSVNRANA